MSKIGSSKLKNNTYKLNSIIESHSILKNTFLINDLNNYGLSVANKIIPPKSALSSIDTSSFAMKNIMAISKSPIADVADSLSMASKIIPPKSALSSFDNYFAMKDYTNISKSSVANMAASLSMTSKMIQPKSALSFFDTSSFSMKNIMAISKSPISDMADALSIASKMIQPSSTLSSFDNYFTMKDYTNISKSSVANMAASLSMASKMIQPSSALNNLNVSISKFDTASDLLKINIIKNTFISIADSLEDISYDEIDEMSNEISYDTDSITDISPLKKILSLIKNTSSQLRSFASPMFNLNDDQACKLICGTLAGVIEIYSSTVNPYSGLFFKFLNKQLFSYMSKNCDGKDD